MKTATLTMFYDEYRLLAISIHAVMKTATVLTQLLLQLELHFNPCSHEDCNAVAVSQKKHIAIFQSMQS